MENHKIQAFIKDYISLTEKHGISIGGCGCCDSPYLMEGKPDILHLLINYIKENIKELPLEIKENYDIEMEELQYEYHSLSDEHKDLLIKLALQLP